MTKPHHITQTINADLEPFEAQFIYECAKAAYEETMTVEEPSSRMARVMQKWRREALERLIVKFGGEV